MPSSSCVWVEENVAALLSVAYVLVAASWAVRVEAGGHERLPQGGGPLPTPSLLSDAQQALRANVDPACTVEEVLLSCGYRCNQRRTQDTGDGTHGKEPRGF